MASPSVGARPKKASTNSPSNSNGKSLLYFRKQNLGDKLQQLMRISPRHVVVVEALVDQILRRLDVAVLLFFLT